MMERTLFFPIFGIPLIVAWLLGGSLFLTVRLGFINLWGLGHSLRVLSAETDPDAVGEVTPFQAMATALSATVGLGNIAGVAIAIQLGGPGAAFWMTLAGFLGMATKFTECTLAQQYRWVESTGQVRGGPMYYLSQGLSAQGLKPAGQLLAVSFAALCLVASLGGGNMFQSNQSAMALEILGEALGWSWLSQPYLYGLVLSTAVAAVIIGGLQRIAQVASTLVPAMVGVYLTGCLWILAHHLGALPQAAIDIWHAAWQPTAVEGGIVGVMVQGLQRGIFSNGAGTGTAAIAHAATQNSEPVQEGFAALLEPLLDTVVICNLTALVCLVTGVYQPGGLGGIELATAAFTAELPTLGWGLVGVVCLFSFSTIISCFYYGEACWHYLFGDRGLLGYKAVYIASTFGGTVIGLSTVVRFSDIALFAMGVPNMLGLLMLSTSVVQSLRAYLGTAPVAVADS